MMIPFPQPDSFGRRIYFLSLSSLDAFPYELSLPSRHFVCLIACDATRVPEPALRQVARRLFHQGLVYLVAWGPASWRVESAVDDAVVHATLAGWPEHDEGVVMTVSEQDESLDDVLWYLLHLAHPDEPYVQTCGSALVVSVGHPDWDVHIRGRLADTGRLNMDITAEE